MTSAQTSTARVGLGTTLTLGVLAAMGPLATDLHLPGLPEIAESLGTTEAAAAATVTLCFAGFALGQLVVGGVGDRYGRRRPTLICLTCFALTGVLCATAPTIEVLLVARFFQGFFGAGSVVCARAAVRDLAKGAAAASLFSQLSMVTMIAPVLAPLLGGQVLRFTSWRGLFWVFTGLCVALLALAAFKLRESLPPERRHAGGGQLRLMGAVLRHPGFGQHLVLSLCQGMILFSYLTMSSLFLQGEYDLSAQAYSWIFAAISVGMLLGHFVNVRVVPSWGAVNMLTASVVGYFIGSITLMLAVVFHAPLPLVVLALLITLPALSPSMPNNMALALIPFGAAAGTASALLGSTQLLAGAFFPTIAVQFGSSGLIMAGTMLAGATIGVVQIFVVVRPSLAKESVDFVGPSAPTPPTSPAPL